MPFSHGANVWDFLIALTVVCNVLGSLVLKRRVDNAHEKANSNAVQARINATRIEKLQNDLDDNGETKHLV